MTVPSRTPSSLRSTCNSRAAAGVHGGMEIITVDEPMRAGVALAAQFSQEPSDLRAAQESLAAAMSVSEMRR